MLMVIYGDGHSGGGGRGGEVRLEVNSGRVTWFLVQRRIIISLAKRNISGMEISAVGQFKVCD